MRDMIFRAISYLKSQGIVALDRDVAEKMGADASNVSRANTGDYSNRFAKRFNEAYGNIFNEDWLINGTGTMLVTEPEVQPKKGDVPFYDVDFAASYLDYYNDEGQPAIDHYVNIPQADGASMVCRASGESMTPTIPNGSHVILREVTDFRWLDYGEIYALVAFNGLRTIKRIRKNKDESKLTLVPDNPDYDINEIDKTDVLRLFRVIGTIQFATP